jgi:hypothetical protein
MRAVLRRCPVEIQGRNARQSDLAGGRADASGPGSCIGGGALRYGEDTRQARRGGVRRNICRLRRRIRRGQRDRLRNGMGLCTRRRRSKADILLESRVTGSRERGLVYVDRNRRRGDEAPRIIFEPPDTASSPWGRIFRICSARVARPPGALAVWRIRRAAGRDRTCHCQQCRGWKNSMVHGIRLTPARAQ